LRRGGSGRRKAKIKGGEIKDKGLYRGLRPGKRGRMLRPYKGDCLFVVLDQGEDVEAGQFGAAFQEGQFYGEGGAFDGAAQLLD
jgi:hypothetical protein